MHVTQDEALHPVEYNFRNKEELAKRGQDFFAEGEQPGTTVLYRGDGRIGEKGRIYRTYSTYAQSRKHLINTFSWLDMTPLGRQDGESGHAGLRFRRRDEYDEEELKGSH